MSDCTTSWNPSSGERPHPPMNVQVVSPYLPGCFDIRWDDPSLINTGPVVTMIQATQAILVSGTPVTEATATGALEITVNPLVEGTAVIIGGVPIFSVHVARTPGGNNFQSNLATVDLVAQDLANAINDANNSFSSIILASASGSTVTLTSKVSGAAGNNIVMTAPIAGITVTSFSGGVNGAVITLAGRTLTAVSGARTSGSNDFSASGTNFDIADSIADAINDLNNQFAAYATATSEFGKVTLTAVPFGAMGNDIVLTTTSSVITFDPGNGRFTGGSGTLACAGKSNSQWNIVGVNIYVSYDGERGPYKRVNPYPITSGFFRHCTNNVLVEDEIVDWNLQWVSKGDMANDRQWRFKTRRYPVVKEGSQAVPATNPVDIEVKIDGFVVPVNAVFGPTGEVDLINVPTYDPSTEKIVQPLLPKSDGSSVVTVTYRHQGEFNRTDLDSKYKLFYRVTTVAIDPTGTTPSGYVETPLGFAPPASPMNVETLDYIWRGAIKKNRWILEQGGERVKLFIRKVNGIKCPCGWDDRLFEYSKQPLKNCPQCFGVGILGGYEGPIDIIIGPGQGQQSIRQTPMGRKREHTYDVWTSPSPLVSQRDFIVKQNGDRYSIGPVEYVEARGAILQQAFTIGVLDQCDIRYRVPVVGTTELAWPETRFTRPQDASCADSDPYPVGYDYQAAPMATEVGRVPDGREQRGRTPVWANLTYGGGG
jgi:hypothetical protein